MSEEAKVETTEVESQETFDTIFHNSELDGAAPATDKEPEPAAEAKAEDAPEKEAEAEPKPEEDEAEAKGEEAEDDKSEAKGEPPAPEDGQKTAPIAALLDERDKRKVAQDRVKELEAQIKDEDKAERPDLLDDPEGFAKSIEDKVERAVQVRHFNASEHRARKEHGDDVVEEAMGIFDKMIKADPLLAQKALNHPEPFDFVIETATTHKAVEEAGGLEEWRTTERTKMRAELKAELEAESTGKSDAKKEARDALPETLAGEANKGERTGPEWSEPPLEELVKDIEDYGPTK